MCGRYIASPSAVNFFRIYHLTFGDIHRIRRPVKAIEVNIRARAIVSDEDYFALHLGNAMALNSMAYNIQSHLGDGPLFAGRESAIQVSAKLEKTHYATEPVTSWRR